MGWFFLDVNVVGDGHQVVFSRHQFAKHFEQVGFGGADGPANPYSQRWKIFGAVRNVMERTMKRVMNRVMKF